MIRDIILVISALLFLRLFCSFLAWLFSLITKDDSWKDPKFIMAVLMLGPTALLVEVSGWLEKKGY